MQIQYYQGKDLKDTVVVPPQGRRKKPIIMRAKFLDNQSEYQVQEQNKTIAKHLLSFGLDKKHTGLD